MIHSKYYELAEMQKNLVQRPNPVDTDFYNGVYEKYRNPVITRHHVPIHWRFDLEQEENPYFMERLGVNSTLNPGAIYHEGRYYLCVRVEGVDRKSFFALAVSDKPTEGFQFTGYPLSWDDIDQNEVNMYDMRLVKHEDGYIYGTYCSESKDSSAAPSDTSSAIAQAGLVRTRDMVNWERLPNIITSSPQQRNVVLHPEFVNGKYGFYTRPQDEFISTGSGGGIAFGVCKDITQPEIEKEVILDERRYHTIYEVKNGQGPSPIMTDQGWIHIAHGVRNTAAGLRYVLYVFATALDDLTRVIAKPGGYFIAPFDQERIGDVSNVIFCNGVIQKEAGDVYIYYASSDTRVHVAHTTVNQLIDYTFHTPQDPFRALDCVRQRKSLIEKNESLLKG
jgi:4-O-beta-D-mannosyl-D-glucose phosphorylase